MSSIEFYEDDEWERKSKLMLNALIPAKQLLVAINALKVMREYPIREFTTFAHIANLYSDYTTERYCFTRMYSHIGDSVVLKNVKSFTSRDPRMYTYTYGQLIHSLNLHSKFRASVELALADKLSVSGLDLITYLTRLHEVEWLLGTNYTPGHIRVDSSTSFVMRNVLNTIHVIETSDLTAFLDTHSRLEGGYDLFEKTGVPATVFQISDSLIEIVFNDGTLRYHEKGQERWFTYSSASALSGSAIVEWLPRFCDDVFITLSYLLISLDVRT